VGWEEKRSLLMLLMLLMEVAAAGLPQFPPSQSRAQGCDGSVQSPRALQGRFWGTACTPEPAPLMPSSSRTPSGATTTKQLPPLTLCPLLLQPPSLSTTACYIFPPLMHCQSMKSDINLCLWCRGQRGTGSFESSSFIPRMGEQGTGVRP